MSMARSRDIRPFVYAGLDVLFAALYVAAIIFVVPTRIPSAAIHLWSLPASALIMSAGTASAAWPKLRARGRLLAIAGGTLMLVSTILLIARVLVSAAFLAGVYGGFGRGAFAFAALAIALIVELVALLPIVQIRYLRSRAGRRAYAA